MENYFFFIVDGVMDDWRIKRKLYILIEFVFDLGYFVVGVIVGGVLWMVIVLLDCLKVYLLVNIKSEVEMVVIVLKSGWLMNVVKNVVRLFGDVVRDLY